MNLDLLKAVSWTKGCFVGQEVAARMENRALVKKRMVVISGSQLAAGSGADAKQASRGGEIRSVNTGQTEELAILKLAALERFRPDYIPRTGAGVEAKPAPSG